MAQASTTAPAPVVVVEPSPTQSAAPSAAAEASIAAYLAAGERMRIVASWLIPVGVALILVIAVAQALGVLPGTARPY